MKALGKARVTREISLVPSLYRASTWYPGVHDIQGAKHKKIALW